MRATGRCLFVWCLSVRTRVWWILERISVSREVPQIMINISEMEDDQWVDDQWVDEHTQKGMLGKWVKVLSQTILQSMHLLKQCVTLMEVSATAVVFSLCFTDLWASRSCLWGVCKRKRRQGSLGSIDLNFLHYRGYELQKVEEHCPVLTSLQRLTNSLARDAFVESNAFNEGNSGCFGFDSCLYQNTLWTTWICVETMFYFPLALTRSARFTPEILWIHLTLHSRVT